MAIALSDLLDEKQVILRLHSRKLPNALREIIQVLAQNGKIDDAWEDRRCRRIFRTSART